VNAVAGLAGMFLYPLGGYIADKSERARLVGVSTFLYALSFLLFVLAPSWQWLAVGMAYQQLVLFYMSASTPSWPIRYPWGRAAESSSSPW
jgi:DHA1 family tetracycline resistance protein-like MFS transporter